MKFLVKKKTLLIDEDNTNEQSLSDEFKLQEINSMYKELDNRKIQLNNDILKYFDHLYDPSTPDVDNQRESHLDNYQKYIKEKIFNHGFLSTLKEDHQEIDEEQCQLNWKKRENQKKSQGDQEISDEEKPNKEEELFYHSFHHTTENLVKYQLISKNRDINFQENDLQTSYLKDYYNKIKNNDKNLRIEKQDTQKSKFYFCSFFYENKRTGDKFIKKECIDEINIGTNQHANIVSADIWKFDFQIGNFQKKKKIFLDIFQGVEPQNILTKKLFFINQKLYYYLKNNDKKKKVFQIYDLQMNQIQDYEFLNQNQIEQNKIFEQNKYENFFDIELPENFQYDLEQLDYCFLTNSSQGIISNKIINHYNLLNQQYVMIKTIRSPNVNKKALLIYSLKNTKQPLVLFQDGEFDDINMGFFTNIDQNNVIFTLKSKFSVYEINCNLKKGIFQKENDQHYNIQNDDRIKIFTDIVDKQNEDQDFNYSSIILQQSQIVLKSQFKEEQFIQSYYIENDGEVKLIYPSHFKDKKQDQNIFANEGQILNQRQEIIKEQIKQINGLKNSNSNRGIIFFTFNNQFQVQFISKNLHTYLISFLNSKDVNFQKIICSKDVIVCYTLKGDVHVYYIQNTFLKKSFFDSAKKICKGKTFLDRIIQQFNWNLQHENNLKKEVCLHNQSYYINKNKTNIFTMQNEIIIKKKRFTFDKNCLLIDLSGLYDEKEKWINDTIKLLKLYPDSSIDHLHLMKYYATDKGIIFFFKLSNNKYEIHNKKLIQNIDENQGLEFIVLKTLNQLNQLIQKEEALVTNNSVIYVPHSLNNFKKEFYQQQMLFKRFLGDNEQKINHKFTFETVVDHLSPCPNWIPFIYHQQVSHDKQDHYFCFLKLDDIFEKVAHYELSQEIEDQIEFSQHINVFIIDYFQGGDEPYRFKDCGNSVVYRNQNYSAKIGSSTMFSRCSDWQHNMFQTNGDQYSTRYQIAINLIFDEINALEIQEFLVTIDKQIRFINDDQKNVFPDQKAKINSYITIVPIQQRFLFKSQLYIFNQRYKNMKFLEKEKLIPIINDDGKIEGTLLMLNQTQNKEGVFRITDNLQVLRQHCKQAELVTLKKYLGQYIYVDKKIENSFQGYFQDGTFKMMIKYQITQEFTILQNLHPNCTDNDICLLLKNQNDQQYFYNIIELKDNDKEKILNPIKGPFCRQTIKQLSFGSQINNQIFICSTAFNKQTIYFHCFDKDESIYWLYYFNKYLMCMSVPNFNEFLFQDNFKKVQKYFQPRYVFYGKSFIHNDFQINALNILNLKKAFILKKDDIINYKFIENSVLHFCLKTDNDKENCIIKCLQLSFYYGLQYDYLKYESIMQNSLDHKNLKALSFIISYLLEQNKDKKLCNILNQDLPQLLSSPKVNINEYFNICYNEEMMIDQVDLMEISIKQSLIFNNFEQFLINEDLPIFGNDESKIQNVHKFDGPFESQNQILQIIINDKQKDKPKESMKFWNNEQSSNEGYVQLQFSYIDFTQIIKKIKIDKILVRLSDEQNGTKYLDLVQEKPQNINQVDDLLISTIINHGANINPSIIEQSTIKRIVELQYQRIKPLIGLQLKIYIFCFVIPFVYNLYYIDSNHDQDIVINYWIVHMNYMLAMSTQILFLVLELADVKYNGFQNYFSNGWNLFDASQFIVFSIHLTVRITYNKLNFHGFQKLGDCMLQVLIIVQSSVKILQYIRYQDEYSFLVQMITQVLIDLVPFFSIFLMYIFVFSMITIIMEADFVEDGYEDVPRFMRILLQTFRNSIGDIQTNNYGGWQNPKNQNNQARGIAIIIIWIFWVLNVFGMLVIMINFLISQVSQTYSNVKDQGNLFLYRQKAQLNQNIYQIENMFGVKEKYKAMIFQQPKKEFQILHFDDQYQQLVEHMRENNEKVVNMNKKMTTFLNLSTESTNNQLQQIQKSIQELQEQFQSQVQIKNLENLIIQQQKERQQDKVLISTLINKVDSLKMQEQKKIKIIKKEQKAVNEQQIQQQSMRRQSLPQISQNYLDVTQNQNFNQTSISNYNSTNQNIKVQFPAIISQNFDRINQNQLINKQIASNSNQESAQILSSQVSENLKKRKSPFSLDKDNKQMFEISPKSVFQQNQENLQKGIQNILNDQRIKNNKSRSSGKESSLNTHQIIKNKQFLNQKMKIKSAQKQKNEYLNYDSNFLKNKLLDFDELSKIQKQNNQIRIMNKSMLDTKPKVNLLPEQIENITNIINMQQKREGSKFRGSNNRSQLQSIIKNFSKMQDNEGDLNEKVTENKDLISVDDNIKQFVNSDKGQSLVKKVKFQSSKIKKISNKLQD